MNKRKYDILVNQKLQQAIDTVFLSDEDIVMSDKKDGLNFNIPDDDEIDSSIELDDIDLDLDLSLDDDEDSLLLDANSDGTAIDLQIDNSELDIDIDGLDDIEELEDEDIGESTSLDISAGDEISLDSLDDNELVEDDEDYEDNEVGEGTGKTIIQSVDTLKAPANSNKVVEVLSAASDDLLSSDAIAAKLSTVTVDASSVDEEETTGDIVSEQDNTGDIDLDQLDDINDLHIENGPLADEKKAAEEMSYKQKEVEEDVTLDEVDSDLDATEHVDLLKDESLDSLDKETAEFEPRKNESLKASENVVAREVEQSPTKGTLLTSLSSNELLDLRVTLSELREDRTNLLSQISDLEETTYNKKQDNLTKKADIDELKIEISILKKRHLTEMEEMRHQLSLAQEKKEVMEAKNRSFQKEIERLGHKLRIDFGQIKQREKELESQLELVSMDADSKVKGRDTKILELKRKIDSLEFNMENVSIKERQSRTDKVLLEEKLNKVVGTLRNSLNNLEEELDVEKIRKEFDV